MSLNDQQELKMVKKTLVSCPLDRKTLFDQRYKMTSSFQSFCLAVFGIIFNSDPPCLKYQKTRQENKPFSN
jgi:hypothetical protein